MDVKGEVLLRGVVGSTAHGLALEGTDDLDEMAVVLEPPDAVLGLKEFDTQVYRTAALREGRHDAKSGPGDVDLTAHGLRKFCRLAAKGNPSILMLLYLPTYSVEEPAGKLLVKHRDAFASKHAGRAFLGYLREQRMRLTGERGGKGVTRPNLVAMYGYDTKYAMHALRLGFQGREYLRTGRMSIPMQEGARHLLMAVRKGEVEFASVVNMARNLEADLEKGLTTTALPDDADMQRINGLLVSVYYDYIVRRGKMPEAVDEW